MEFGRCAQEAQPGSATRVQQFLQLSTDLGQLPRLEWAQVRPWLPQIRHPGSQYRLVEWSTATLGDRPHVNQPRDPVAFEQGDELAPGQTGGGGEKENGSHGDHFDARRGVVGYHLPPGDSL